MFPNNHNNFALKNNHPLIKNTQQYYTYTKIVSIHSTDRNYLKYPDSADFEIELPQEYNGITSIALESWAFPSLYSPFSPINNTVSLTFKIDSAYNPTDHGVVDPLAIAIHAALAEDLSHEYIAVIEAGFYDQIQMYTELQLKMNEAITEYLVHFFTTHIPYNYALPLLTDAGGYARFVVTYNHVGQKMWFGNIADRFTLTNNSDFYLETEINNDRCARRDSLPQYADWGLPAFIGFTRTPVTALNSDEVLAINPGDTNVDKLLMKPRFYYGSENESINGSGFWMEDFEDAVLVGATNYFLEAPLKINLMGEAYFYMEIPGLECLDETSPYNVSRFTTTTNETNGRVNSAFAKIPVPSTPVTQIFDGGSASYKWFNPPKDKWRKIRVKMRYHNGQKVRFGLFNFSFNLAVTMLIPQNAKNFAVVDTQDVNGMGTIPSGQTF